MRPPYSSSRLRRGARRALLAAAVSSSLLATAHADYASEVASENPLLYYRFNDSVATDDQPPAFNSGSLGAAGDGYCMDSFTRGVAGAIAGNTAMAFVNNATVDTAAYTGAVNIPLNAALNPSPTGTNPFTVECWVLPSRNTSTFLSPVNSMSFTTGRAGYLLYQSSATWELRMGNKAVANNFTAMTGGAVTVGQWQHLAFTYSGGTNGTMTLYVNGVPVNSVVVTNGYEANDNAPFAIGGTSAPGRTFDGAVDEVAFFPTSLAPARILARVNERTNNPAGYAAHVAADSPAGYWRLDEPAFVPRTPPVADNTGTLGNAADGTYSAAAKNGNTGPSPASGFGGFNANNSALDLGKALGFVSSGQSLLNNRSSFTVTGWVKRGAVHSVRGGYFGQNDVLEFGDAGGGTQIEAWNASAGRVLTDAPYPFADNEWGFIAYRANGSVVELYLNGVLNKTTVWTTANYGSSAFNFNIGGGGIFGATGDFFRGEIDEVAFFDRAVTPGRIKQLYDAAKGNVAVGLVSTVPALTPNAEIFEGDPYTLSIDPTGTPPFTYQWKVNNVDIPSSNSPTYTVLAAAANTPVSSPYIYTVTVAGNGTVTSDPTDVYVTPRLKWTSAAPVNPGIWEVGGSTNWKTYTAGVAASYDDGYAVYFDDTVTGGALATVNLAAEVTPLAVVFDNSAKNYSVTGPHVLTSPQNQVLLKKGTGTVEFSNDAVVAEQVRIEQGILRIGNGTNGSFSPETAVTVAGGQFQINPAAASTYDNATTVSSGSMAVTGSGDLEFLATVTGAGNQIFDRNGTVSIKGNNQIGGAITINSGTVLFDGNQEANRLPINKLVTVNPGGTMEIRGVNALPTHLNSVDVTLDGGLLNVIAGGSPVTGVDGSSHGHLRNLGLNGGTVMLGYSGGGGSYNGESFQLNGDISAGGSAVSTIGYGSGANNGNSGIAFSAPAGATTTHTITVADAVTGPAPDLVISAELENSDALAADSLASTLVKAGPGTLRLAGNVAHGFSAAFRVDEGTLEATGSISAPLTIAGVATFAPGDGVGTFNAGTTTLGGTYRCEIDGPSSDKLVANGNLFFQGGAQVSFSVLGALTLPVYEIATCNGILDGPVPTGVNVPPGYTLTTSATSLVLLQSSAPTTPVITFIKGSTVGALGGSDFNSSNGGFTVSAPVTPQTDWAYTAGAWTSAGQSDVNGTVADNTSYLISPPYTLTKDGVVSASFSHRYSFELDYDAGAVDVRLNSGNWVRVQGSAFSQNGYNGIAGSEEHSLAQQPAFVFNSPGHPAFITSTCKLLAGEAGDTVELRFAAAYDNNTGGDQVPPGWQIDSVQFTEGGTGGAMLNWALGTMQFSDNLEPPWTDIIGPGPVLVDLTLTPKRFFRLKP
ncbi:LamG-like jellyroll fold domain-containing protein [Luteolibacter sp. Populi]|uniref:LamG-like jellyroll fold domain-containing protein n=1 Tax=Luteolibacter sp. Populi TaxID=3230487 RepID=UPI003465DAFD